MAALQQRASRRQARKAALGARAESLVADYLAAGGYAIVDRNVRVGRLEIDIIARRGSLVVFCEVRARSDDRWVAPHHTVDARKATRVRSAALQWLKQNASSPLPSARLDVASVVIPDDGPPKLDYFEGAL